MSDLAKNIAEAVMDNLRRRKGIFDDIEPDVQEMIQGELEPVIQREISGLVVRPPTIPRPPVQGEGRVCPNCGNTMQRTGACHTCSSCGFNDGCG